MDDFDHVLRELETLIGEMEQLDQPTRERVFTLLDAVDALHRLALGRLGSLVERDALEPLLADQIVAWLLDAYGFGIDEHPAVEAGF